MNKPWTSVKELLPEVGEVVLCRVRFHRFGQVADSETREAKFIGMNNIINKPMFDIDTYDQSYAEVTHWKKAKAKAKGRHGSL